MNGLGGPAYHGVLGLDTQSPFDGINSLLEITETPWSYYQSQYDDLNPMLLVGNNSSQTMSDSNADVPSPHELPTAGEHTSPSSSTRTPVPFLLYVPH